MHQNPNLVPFLVPWISITFERSWHYVNCSGLVKASTHKTYLATKQHHILASHVWTLIISDTKSAHVGHSAPHSFFHLSMMSRTLILICIQVNGVLVHFFPPNSKGSLINLFVLIFFSFNAVPGWCNEDARFTLITHAALGLGYWCSAVAGVGKDTAETLHSVHCFSLSACRNIITGSVFAFSFGSHSIPKDNTTLGIFSRFFFY